jgi:hypothetical protein
MREVTCGSAVVRAREQQKRMEFWVNENPELVEGARASLLA